MTDQFLTLGKLRAAADQVAELPMAIMPHPIGGLALEEVQARADGVVDQIASALVRK